VTLNDVNEGDATLQFLEKSHLFHKTFANDHGDKIDEKDIKADWYQLSDEQMMWYENKGCTRTSIRCKAGDIVFWDSRTIHAGQEAIKGREKPNERYVIYVCMQPRSFASEKMLQKKLKAFEEQRTTSHWPCNIKLFSKNPRTYGRELKAFRQLPAPGLTELGMRLAGF
jgi:ectoine hydroxylase-related dioxygenase (phytanoyl-CoA dioxygenase family)